VYILSLPSQNTFQLGGTDLLSVSSLMDTIIIKWTIGE
jgi:hypothetical protein